MDEKRVSYAHPDYWRQETEWLAQLAKEVQLEPRRSPDWKRHVRAMAAALAALIDPAVEDDQRRVIRSRCLAELVLSKSHPREARPKDPLVELMQRWPDPKDDH